MKHWLALIAISIYTIGESTATPPTTLFTIDDQNYIDVIIGRKTCLEDNVPKQVAISTGPFTMRVSTDALSDCYQADGVYPNGTLINERWVPCN